MGARVSCGEYPLKPSLSKSSPHFTLGDCDNDTEGVYIGHTDVVQRTTGKEESISTFQGFLPDIMDTRLVLKTVRVFLSSTFTDTRVDRNALMEEVFDPIRDLCQQHGIAFEVVDLRWGVRQESVDDHRVVNICMEEIKRCQETSLGIAFMALLGDKYGWRPLPPSIVAKDLETLLTYIDSSDAEVIREWYLRDDNAVPSTYNLQPISIQFPVRSKDEEERDRAWKDWGAVERRIWNCLRAAADVAELETDAEIKRVFKMSVTRMEVEKGVVQQKIKCQPSLVVDRRFDSVDVADKKASDFVDIKDKERVSECKDLISELKEKCIPSSLDVSSVLKFTNLQWHQEGLTRDKHGWYIDEMCAKVKNLLTDRINEIIKEIGPPNPLKEEIIRHALFCRDQTRSFEGRANILTAIHNYVRKECAEMPLVLYGESGIGKTALVAKAMTEIQERNPNMAVLYRFCGTTPESSTGRELTLSLINQIKEVYDIKKEIEEDYASVCQAFPEVMEKAAKDKPLCIMIDSLDQLTDENEARRFLEWLPRRIPNHVWLIVSTLPDVGGCFNRLQTFKISNENFIKVERLGPSDGEAILDSWLAKKNRRLTKEQRDLVLQSFNSCPLPLYLELVFNECCTWPSSRKESEITLQKDVPSMVNSLYDRLERYHGKILVSRVLGLLAAVSDGVNKDDILNILSCDDELLKDVLVWHDPPKKRLPPLLLARLRYDLGQFLVERGAHGVSLFALYHRQFIEVAAARYLHGEQYKATHTAIAKYFSGHYYNIYGKDRVIPDQPVAYSHKALNLRKLGVLPHSLMEASDFDELRNCLGDLDFIQAKCMAGLGYDMMSECSLGYQYALENNANEKTTQDLSDILQFLRSEVHILAKLPLLTFQQAVNSPQSSWICGAAVRKQSEWNKGSQNVLPQPEGWVEWTNKPNVTEAFLFELGGHSKGVLSTCFSRDDEKIISASEDNSIRLWNSHTGSLLAQLDGHTGAVTSLKVSPDGMLIASSSADQSIKLWSYQSEKCIQTLQGHQERITSISFNKDGTKILSASIDKTLKIWEVGTGKSIDTILGHLGHPLCCAWSPVSDDVAASCGDELELFIWDLSTRKKKHILQGHTIDKAMVNFPDKKKLNGHEKYHYDSLLWSVDFSQDGTLLASTGTDSNVFVWNVDTGERKCSFVIPNDGSAVCFVQAQQGTYLAAASAPHMTITLFEIGEKPQVISVLGGHSDWVMGVGFSSDGSRLTSASRDKTIRVWDINAAEKIKEVRFHSERCWCVAYSDDGRWLASASDDFKVCIWDTTTLQHVLVYEGHEKKRTFSCGVRACAFSHDSSLVASGGDEMIIRIWSRETGEDKIILPCQSCLLPWCLRFSPDDQRLIAVGEFSKGVLMWDLKNQTKIADFGGHERFCQYTEFSPSGNLIISCSIDNTAKIWDAKTFDLVTTLEHPNWVTCGAFSHKETTIATCSPDLNVRLWSIKDFQEIAVFKGHVSEIRMVCFSPDDSHVASAALDQSIRIWHLESQTLVHVFYGASGLWGLAWHPTNEDVLASGDAVGYLYFLKLKRRSEQ
ncbi:NACHT domain- and WD repeat-containing protein 1 [Exaiptasia diaphana]|uniref:Uncharacterized protein n=1 Tax=Exaiptasia diaphana TaxID=2652724 RepID=A0A913Y824_EXADI|nr:NACHT domain- and WD repeat-containing protein 1 [Exaiptasia diaphana]KXJ19576.1 NACHT domain- and WD repeat-containing protein 1 [Exaiptasia diaphana]